MLSSLRVPQASARVAAVALRSSAVQGLAASRSLASSARGFPLARSSGPRSAGSQFASTSVRHLSSASSYENILVEQKGKIAIITLHRPKALNALNSSLVSELEDCISKFEKDPSVTAMVLTGSEKAFAAGADIKEMASKKFADVFKNAWVANWGNIGRARKPIVAAVNGFALGGGCEMAMMCDIIYAGENAKFGQPEITIGTIPGGGGTQRLIRVVGKSRAMEMILTGDQIDAKEALSLGLVSKVYPVEETLPKAIECAEKIASFSQPAVMIAKEATNMAYETGMQQGLFYELRAFWSTFATHDQKEGMGAFAEKRKPVFKDE